VIGSSTREDNYDKLKAKILEHKLPLEYFDWLLDTRKYG
jgi:aspartyl/asparaginyl-tRNA synthetase